MDRPSPSEMKQATLALAPELPDLEVLDGSTIDRWCGCPFAAVAVEQGKCNTLPSIVRAGSEVHEAISRLLCLWIESGGALSPGELAHNMESELRGTAPDVQPEAIRGCQASVWAIGKFLFGIHPENILAFDGGEDLGRSGQLAIDLEGVNVRLTSEIDLLYSGPSPELLHEVDWKTGWKFHDATDVADSGQFQRHAILVFEHYPQVNGLECQLWDTRTNQRTFKVVFRRERIPDYLARVLMAIQSRWEHAKNPPTWPTLEGCRICPAAAFCPVADQPIKSLVSDPPAFVRDMLAVQARLDMMSELAAAYVDANGTIDAGNVRFGRDKPAAERKKPASLYTIKTKEEK